MVPTSGLLTLKYKTEPIGTAIVTPLGVNERASHTFGYTTPAQAFVESLGPVHRLRMRLVADVNGGSSGTGWKVLERSFREHPEVAHRIASLEREVTSHRTAPAAAARLLLDLFRKH